AVLDGLFLESTHLFTLLFRRACSVFGVSRLFGANIAQRSGMGKGELMILNEPLDAGKQLVQVSSRAMAQNSRSIAGDRRALVLQKAFRPGTDRGLLFRGPVLHVARALD